MTLTLFRGGTVVTASAAFNADLLAVDGRIVAVGETFPAPDGTETVNCLGRFLLPGGVDVHTHLDVPMMGTKTADDFESGTEPRCVEGQPRSSTSPSSRRRRLSLRLWRHGPKASGHARTDYGFHIAVSHLYPGIDRDLVDLALEGITSVKIYMAYRGALMLNDGEILEILGAASRAGSQVAIHAENGDVIDRLAADMVAAGNTQPLYHEKSRLPPLRSRPSSELSEFHGS